MALTKNKCNLTPNFMAAELSLTLVEPKAVFCLIVLIRKLYNYNNNR